MDGRSVGAKLGEKVEGDLEGGSVGDGVGRRDGFLRQEEGKQI